MTPTVSIKNRQDFSNTESFQLKHFCKQHKQSLPSQNETIETIFYGTQLIGLVRLIPTENQTVFWLRALYIAPNYRNQGFARQLMQHCLNNYPSHRVVIFALSHLENFYHTLGFAKTADNTLPETLQAKWQKAQKEGKTWLLMESLPP